MENRIFENNTRARSTPAQPRAEKPGIVFSLLYVDTAGGAPVSSDLRAAHRMFAPHATFTNSLIKVLCARLQVYRQYTNN